MFLWLLVAGREMRTLVEGPIGAAGIRPMRDTRKVEPARVSLMTARGHDDAGRLDAVAGSEFVDDRIRLRE